ncbi:MAG TPA: alpha/beta fold hydrolase [Terriglobales bacterium]|nr:alpha/beta fold hydrolase [Terriglobales bacterium]
MKVAITPNDPHKIPVEDLNVTVERRRWRYRHAGSGPPLLLIHGLLGHSYSWRNVVPALASQAEVYAVDLPGSGLSEPSADGDGSLRAGAHGLFRFMDAAGLSRCDIMGTSYGGGLAMMLAALAPQRVRRLVLVAPVNPWSAHGRILAPFLCSPVIAPLVLWLLPRLDMLHEFYFRRLFGDTQRIRPGTLEGYMKPLLRLGGLANTISVLRSWNRDLEQLRSILPHLPQVPTLLLWGSRDAAVNPASARELKKYFRDCRLVMMEGIGHLPYEEAPEEFSLAVAEFLHQTAGTIGKS